MINSKLPKSAFPFLTFYNILFGTSNSVKKSTRPVACKEDISIWVSQNGRTFQGTLKKCI